VNRYVAPVNADSLGISMVVAVGDSGQRHLNVPESATSMPINPATLGRPLGGLPKSTVSTVRLRRRHRQVLSALVDVVGDGDPVRVA